MPKDLIKFDLKPYNVPLEAIAIMFKWTIAPPSGVVRLYRTMDDPEPQILTGSEGNGHIGLVEPQTLYWLASKETSDFKISLLGHETISGL